MHYQSYQLIRNRALIGFNLPQNCELVNKNNTAEGVMVGLMFHGTDRVTVRIVQNDNGTTTFHIQDLFSFWTTDMLELERILAQYAVEGNWIQEK